MVSNRGLALLLAQRYPGPVTETLSYWALLDIPTQRQAEKLSEFDRLAFLKLMLEPHRAFGNKIT